MASTYLKAPKVIKGQKQKKPARNVLGPAILYYRKIPGTSPPSDAVKEEAEAEEEPKKKKKKVIFNDT